MKTYDIFISYRRTAYDTANLIATRLRAAGYSVFFDLETLRSGKFNEQLYDVIDNCRDFILVLSPDALDRCQSADDWVRREVCRAMGKEKNVIPIMLSGFSWPAPMPEGMENLCDYQALTASSVEYFDLALQKLQQRYLKSKAHVPLLKVLKLAGISVAAVAVLLLILWTVFMVLSIDTCQKYATIITKNAGQVYMLTEENHMLTEEWKNFDNAFTYEQNPNRRYRLQEDMLSKIDVTIKNVESCWVTDSSVLDISPFQGFLLSLHGINSEEIAVSPQLANLYYNNFVYMLGIVRASVLDPTTISRRYSTVLLKGSAYSFNAYYATVLSELSHFPADTRRSFDESYKHWTYYPVQYQLDADESYYENIINIENKRAEDLLSKYGAYLERQVSDIEDLEHRNDELEERIKALDGR